MLLDIMFMQRNLWYTDDFLGLARDGDLDVAAAAASCYSRHNGWFV